MPRAPTWETVMRSQHFSDSGGQAGSLPCTVGGILGKEMHIKAGDNFSVCIHKSRFCCAFKELFFLIYLYVSGGFLIRKLSTSADPGFPTSSEVRLNICQPSQLFYHFPAELSAARKRKGVLSPRLKARAQLPCQCKSGNQDPPLGAVGLEIKSWSERTMLSPVPTAKGKLGHTKECADGEKEDPGNLVIELHLYPLAAWIVVPEHFSSSCV